MSSKFSSIFYTTFLESVFRSPNYELIIIIIIFRPNQYHYLFRPCTTTHLCFIGLIESGLDITKKIGCLIDCLMTKVNYIISNSLFLFGWHCCFYSPNRYCFEVDCLFFSLVSSINQSLSLKSNS